MANGREWSTQEIQYLRKHYPAGTPVSKIADHLNRTANAVKRKAQENGLVHPGRSSRQLIRNFEAMHGKPLHEIALGYRDRHLSRSTLAHDIGIERLALRKALGDELWNSWPFMTIGRIDANKTRQKAA